MYTHILIKPSYVKKEDIPSFYKSYNLRLGIILLSTAIAFGITHFIVSSRIAQLYHELGAQLPMISIVLNRLSTPMILIAIGIGLYFLNLKPNQNAVNEELSKYEDGEMVNVKKLINGKYEILTFFMLGVMVALFIISNVVPINVIKSGL